MSASFLLVLELGELLFALGDQRRELVALRVGLVHAGETAAEFVEFGVQRGDRLLASVRVRGSRVLGVVVAGVDVGLRLRALAAPGLAPPVLLAQPVAQ